MFPTLAALPPEPVATRSAAPPSPAGTDAQLTTLSRVLPPPRSESPATSLAGVDVAPERIEGLTHQYRTDRISPGARVAVEMPGGSIYSGLVVESAWEQRTSLDLLGIEEAGLATTAGPGCRSWRASTAERRLDLRIQLNPLQPDPLTERLCARAAEQMAQAVMRRATQTQEQDMATMFATPAATTVGADGLWRDGYIVGATPSATTISTASGATTAFANAEDIVGTILRIREQFPAASATPTARVWYSTDCGGVWPVESTDTTLTWSLTGGAEVRTVASYVRYSHSWDNWFDGTGKYDRSPENRLREMMRLRTGPTVLRHRDPHNSPTRPGLAATADFREMRARDTLAKLIGEERFRRFLRDGFVSCRAKSGRTYQIFPGSKFTRVFQDGKEQPRLCVVLRGNFPDTDSLIVRYLMILNNEDGFRKLAINQGLAIARRPDARRDERPLAALYAGYKPKRSHPATEMAAHREEAMTVAS
jgi:hypothetical protein